MLFADLHIHSKYSRATSNRMDIEHLSYYGSMKGLNVIGSGDITHPLWQKEVKESTEYLGNGIYKSRFNDMRFVLSSELSTIYSQGGKVRRVHHLVLFPDFDVVGQFVDELRSRLQLKGKKCNLEADGRPIIGMSSEELAELLFSVSGDIVLIPAHIWTPWFSLFGSNSGFDSVEECYGKHSSRIYALETGLSSDPPMNWRVREARGRLLVSNSDCHSPFVNRIGRECNIFDEDIEDFTYTRLKKDLISKKLRSTIEVNPNYGKYHYDGHRNCNVRLSPKESIAKNNKCPVCGNRLTLGVLHRVEELADRPEGYVPDSAVPFEYHIPLIELISMLTGRGVATKHVFDIYKVLIRKYSNEFNLMLNAPVDDVESSFKGLGRLVSALRSKTMKFVPGYDGVYGKPIINSNGQKELTEFLGA